MTKRIIAIALLCFSMVDVLAWGATGHRATGYVADQYLKEKARKRIAVILEGEPLAMTTTWMDDVRSDSTYNYLIDWHWTTVPDGKTYADVEASPDGKLVAMIEKVIAELKSKKLSAKQEREYLKILIHLVGDIHQPLHVGKPGDRGGNEVKVKYFGSDSNLHSVWDSGMIDGSKLSYTELATSLAKPDAVTVKKLQSATVREWAAESMTYRDQVYNIGKGSLSYQYVYRNFDTVRKRIQQAGIRLAGILNDIYGV